MNSSYRICFVCLLPVLFFCATGNSGVQAQSFSLNSKISVLEDPKGLLSITDITDSSRSQSFTKNISIVPGGGFSRSVFWVKISDVDELIQSLSAKLILEIDNPLIDSVTLYYTNAEGAHHHKLSGSMVPFSAREIETPNPAFSIKKESFSSPVYIRIKSSTIVNFPINIYSGEGFIKNDKQSFIVYGIYLGIMALFFVYSLIGLVRTRNILFLFFCLFVVNVLFLILSLKGLGFVYLWPENISWNYYSPNFFTCFYVCMVTKFSIDILQVKKFMPAWHLPLHVLWGITIAVFALSFFTDRYLITILNNTYVHGLLILYIILSFAVWKRGNRAGLYFALGWICFFVFTIPFILKNFGKLPSTFFTVNGPFIGSVFEVLFFSLAAGKKVESMYIHRKEADLLFSKYETEMHLLKERIEKLLADNISSGNTIGISAGTVEEMIDHPLSKREKEVMELLVRGHINKEMADKLFVSENTIKKHISSIYQKLEVNTRAAASKKAIEMGLFKPNA